MQKNYVRVMKAVEVSEGGWTNDPDDPGGPTMYGIIQVEYDAWRDLHHQPRQSVRKISDQDVDDIFAQQYAAPLHFNDLSSGIDYCVLDFGINSGVVRSAKQLQQMLRVGVDGHIGVITLAAARGVNDVEGFINTFCDKRLVFLRGLSTFWKFGKGWTARVARIRNDSLALAKAG